MDVMAIMCALRSLKYICVLKGCPSERDLLYLYADILYDVHHGEGQPAEEEAAHHLWKFNTDELTSMRTYMTRRLRTAVCACCASVSMEPSVTIQSWRTCELHGAAVDGTF